MKLKDYVQQLDPTARERFMTALKLSPAYLYQLEKGIRRLSFQKAKLVRELSGGAVTLRDTRPDIVEEVEAA